eukprot:704401-Heterocapsa_arctica.AAC.1
MKSDCREQHSFAEFHEKPRLAGRARDLQPAAEHQHSFTEFREQSRLGRAAGRAAYAAANSGPHAAQQDCPGLPHPCRDAVRTGNGQNSGGLA